MMKCEWQKKIIDNKEAGYCFFTGGISEKKINYIENELGVILPESYKFFLGNYGSGGMFGVEIIGCGYSEIPRVVEMTKFYRKYGLPKDLVVIEDVDEYQYCLQTSLMNDGECPVVNWAIDDDIIVEDENFSVFFLREICEAEEDWEDE